MGRFQKLDFNANPGAAPQVAQEDKWPNQDERGCLKLGDERFQRGFMSQR